MSILHFGHLNRLFRNGRQIFYLGSQVVSTSQVSPEDLSVQLTGVGVGRGPCEGVSKIQFTEREAPSGKYSTCEKWPSTRLKNILAPKVVQNRVTKFSL